MIAILALLAWMVFWPLRPAARRNAPQPVAVNSTPLIHGRCAIDRRTGLLWGRIVRIGNHKGIMDRYVVQTLPHRRLKDVAINEARMVRCEDVTGPKTLDYGTRTP